MQAQDINAFVKAIKNVCATMLQLHVTHGKPKLKTDPMVEHDVSGIIGMSGDVTGTVAISFPMETAERMVSILIGSNITSEHEDFADAIGELGNMIAGNAKKDFHGRNVSISIPNVVLGSAHAIFHSRDVPCITIPVSTRFGDFAVDVSIKLNEPVTVEPSNRSREGVGK